MKGLNISEEKIWNQFEPLLDKISITEDFAKEIADALSERNKKMKAAALKQAENYKIALESLEYKEDRIYDDFVKGELDTSAYQRQLKRIKEELSHLTNLLTEANLIMNDIWRETSQTGYLCEITVEIFITY